MSFRMLFYATVAMPFAAGLASAELRLSEPEMDTMTAGLVLPEQFALIDCPACAVTTSASTSLNGVTTATGSSGVHHHDRQHWNGRGRRLRERGRGR